MNAHKAALAGTFLFTILYPAIEAILSHVPNPVVPGGFIAFNMILPVLSGHFYGPKSGFMVGALGTLISAVIFNNHFAYAAMIPHAIMGGTAGVIGRYRSEIYSAFSIIMGHALNLLAFDLFHLMTFSSEKFYFILLGLMTETMIDMVGIITIILTFNKRLYQTKRW